MPHERANSKRRTTYYSLVGQHRHTVRPSLSPTLGSRFVRYPYSNQSWCDDAQPTPHFPEPELNYGGCIVEEEIPPNWEENTMEQTEPIGIDLPLNFPKVSMGGCVVEEEIPPQIQDDFKRGTTPNVSGPHNEAHRTDWDECWGKEETHSELHIGEQAHPALGCHDFPSSCRLTKDHLALIFEMRRDLADQLHNQHVLSRRLDMLFNSLSSEPAKSCYPTCCQLFTFTVHHDKSPGSPHI
jgi:hypothetical protein